MTLPLRPYLTSRAREAFTHAHDLADQRGDEDLTPALLALGLLKEGRSIAVHVLHGRGVPLDVVARELEAELPAPAAPRARPDVREWSPADEQLVAAAVREARVLGTEYYGCEHLLLALLRDPAAAPARVLARHGVGYADVHAEILRLIQSSREATPRTISKAP